VKRAVTIAQQYTNVVTLIVRHHQVQFAVTIEISHRHRRGTCSGGVVHGRLKCPVAVAEEDADVAAACVCHHQVEFTVVVEISHRHRRRI
jgi:acyl-coenzyme A thioesterase PaaI-like protein